jgi:hypothetical protein
MVKHKLAANEKLSLTANDPVDMGLMRKKAVEVQENNCNMTAYKKEYCDQLVEHMASGLDFHSFAKIVRVSKSTLDRWAADRPGFTEAKELGEAAYHHHWIELGVRGAKGLVKNYNASTWIFTMKNKFGWKDIIENTNKNESTTYEVQVTKEGRFASARPKAV